MLRVDTRRQAPIDAQAEASGYSLRLQLAATGHAHASVFLAQKLLKAVAIGAAERQTGAVPQDHGVFTVNGGQKHLKRAIYKLNDFVMPETFFETKFEKRKIQ